MKKWCCKIFISFLPLLGMAQKSIYKNELSFSFAKLSSQAFNKDYPLMPLKPNLGFNLSFKYKLYPNLFLRANQSFYKYLVKDQFGNSFNQFIPFNIQEINTSLGFEFRYFISKNKKLILFTGLDMNGFKYLNRFDQFGHFAGSDHAAFKVKRLGIGVQPLAGVCIYPAKRFVISLETAALLGISKVQATSSIDKGFVTQTFENNKQQEIYGQIFFLRGLTLGWRF